MISQLSNGQPNWRDQVELKLVADDRRDASKINEQVVSCPGPGKRGTDAGWCWWTVSWCHSEQPTEISNRFETKQGYWQRQASIHQARLCTERFYCTPSMHKEKNTVEFLFLRIKHYRICSRSQGSNKIICIPFKSNSGQWWMVLNNVNIMSNNIIVSFLCDNFLIFFMGCIEHERKLLVSHHTMTPYDQSGKLWSCFNLIQSSKMTTQDNMIASFFSLQPLRFLFYFKVVLTKSFSLFDYNYPL